MEVAEATTPTITNLPAIGGRWPGVAGIYAGITRGEDGAPDAHLVLLDAKPDEELAWAEALKWAEGLGDGAHVPTRFESALLYANVRDQLDTSNWHWTSTQYSARSAWGQDFIGGFQVSGSLDFEACSRAVRRFPL